MQQIKNFLIKREQSQARLRFAECEKSRLKAKIILTLVALLALTTQAWATDVYVAGNGDGNWLNGAIWDSGAAENKMTEQNGVYSITFTNVDANPYLQFKFAIDGGWAKNYGCSPTTEIELNKTISNTEDGGNIMFELTEPADVTISFNLSEQTFMISTDGMKVAPSATPVDLTRGTGEKINEWTLTNGMPAGNVLVTVAYKDRTAMALKYGEQAITDEANAVTAYKGFEKEFADALNLDAAVKNIEPALSGGDAVAVTTTAADYIFESSDGNKIGFKTATKGIYDLTGTLDQMEFRDLTENSPVTLTVNYKGTADLESSMAFLRVTIEKKTYTVSLADNTKDADSWKGNVNDAQTDVNLPITKLDKGDAVTLKYNGRLKVKAVTATFEPNPLATPLTIEAITPGTITVNSTTSGMQYSLDGGITKTSITGTKITIPETGTLAAGDKVQFYGTATSYNGTGISGSGGFKCKVYGNIMSLISGTDFATATTLTEDGTFASLFSSNKTLTDASGLLLPATTLTEGCYNGMFEDCSNMTAGPAELPAKNLTGGCYNAMFDGCTSLTKAPKLPATTLADACYNNMFRDCTSLTTAPKLPATTLAISCYQEMFRDCTSLTSAYVKAAFTGENYMCSDMFDGCSASGAVLHTTSVNKESWETRMGSDKTWPTWSVADDWEE